MTVHVMNRRACWRIGTLALCLWTYECALGDAYAEARDELIAAYQAQDYPAMRLAAHSAVAARPGYPGALFNLALAEVLDGDPATALQTLQALLEQGIDFGVGDMPEFEALQSLPAWPAFEAATERLNEPVGEAEVVFTLDVGDFVPEGIAVDDAGELYLGGIRHGSIVRIGETTTTLSDADRHFAVFGMRLDGQGGLWFASANVPEHKGPLSSDGPKTGLYRLDLATNTVRGRELPLGDEAQVLGDLVFADEDTILATESLTGSLYRFSVSAWEFDRVIAPGTLRSMQGLVLDASRDYLYVADYVGGLFRLRLGDNVIERVTSSEPSALFGIDGLYRYGNELIAIQNGIRPNRVVGLTLSPDGLTVQSSRTLARNLSGFDEPTLGQVVGDEFYFVANSHWNRFDREGNLPSDLAGPIVMKLSLRR